MALILNIETATTVCSAALSRNGALFSLREENKGYSHSENLTSFIEDMMQEAGLSFSQLDAVAVSSGPGSYTGLRIGVSTAKGYCFALDRPLIAIPTLESMAFGFIQSMNSHEDDEKLGSLHPGYHLSDWKNYTRNYPRALSFREQPTEAEMLLWKRLKGKKTGFKFRRQHVIDQFIVDFVCITKRLVIEVDGGIHLTKKEYDEGREAVLKNLGFDTIRFTNEEVLNNIESVLHKIMEALSLRTDLSPDPFPGERGAENPGNTKKVLPFGKDLGWVLPMIDARRMEVYCALYDETLKVIEPVSAKVIDESSFADVLSRSKIYFFGDGAGKCKPLLSNHPQAIFIDGVMPTAESMTQLAEEKFLKGEFENVALFEPFYLKEFVAGVKK